MASLIIGGQESTHQVGIGEVGGSAPADPSAPDVSSYGVQSPRPLARRRLTAAAVAAVTLAFVPVVTAAASVDVSSGAAAQVRPARTIQYQPTAGPVFVPAIAATPFVAPVAPDRVPRISRARVSEGVAPLYLPDITDPPPVLSWAPTFPDRTRRAPRSAEFPEPVAAIYLADVTDPAPLLAWAPVTPPAARPLSRARLASETGLPPLQEAAPAVPELAWQANAPERLPLRLRARDLPSATAPPAAPTLPPAADAIAAATSGQVRPPQMRQYAALSGPVLVPVAAPAAPDLVVALYPDRVARVPPRAHTGAVGPLYIADVTDPAPLVLPPVAPSRVLPRPRVPLGLSVAPVEPPAAVPAPDLPQTANGTGINRPNRSVFYEPETGPVFVPDVALDWLPVAPDHRPRVLPRQVLASAAPLYVPDVTAVAPPLSWAGVAPERTRRAIAVLPSQQQAFAWHPVTPAAQPAPDQWTPVYPDRVRRAPRGQALTVVGPLYLPDVTDPAPVLSWGPSYPDRTRRALALRPANHLAFVWHPITPPAEPVPDFWAPVYPDRTRRAPAGQILTVVAPIYVADVTAAVPFLSWAPVFPGPRLRVHPPAPGGVIAPVTVEAPTLALDWLPVLPDSFRRGPGRRHGAVVLPPDVPAVPLVEWAPVGPETVLRRPVLRHAAIVWPVYVPDVTAVVPLLSWQPTYPDRVRYVRLLVALHQAFAWNPETLAGGPPPEWIKVIDETIRLADVRGERVTLADVLHEVLRTAGLDLETFGPDED